MQSACMHAFLAGCSLHWRLEAGSKGVGVGLGAGSKGVHVAFMFTLDVCRFGCGRSHLVLSRRSRARSPSLSPFIKSAPYPPSTWVAHYPTWSFACQVCSGTFFVVLLGAYVTGTLDQWSSEQLDTAYLTAICIGAATVSDTFYSSFYSSFLLLLLLLHLLLCFLRCFLLLCLLLLVIRAVDLLLLFLLPLLLPLLPPLLLFFGDTRSRLNTGFGFHPRHLPHSALVHPQQTPVRLPHPPHPPAPASAALRFSSSSSYDGERMTNSSDQPPPSHSHL